MRISKHIIAKSKIELLFYSRYRRHWRKEKALTRGGLGFKGTKKSAEVIVVVATSRNKRYGGLTGIMKD